ncbi:uncharacterized protein LOC125527470 [Triticum urartu]|uniref:C2 domain-containing protein n=1 Tax=Triticum urartu TaxID=4572 RepID=A0A8R7UZ76_TRIUA|nr:uncharacterized protein LOC125512991 [Triticum urartu]XP_048534003.1 uncharacterized protein LOC125512999 [Triticum urartu]XP_048547934.1 uncharacterized protein LOC125527470 [Triticum urartu]
MSAIVGHDDGSPPSPLHLLEVTVISAQDLHRRHRLSHRVRAYAVAWIDGTRKLRTEVDLAGGADPTWNDRFLFRVDAGFLKSETAAVVVEVRATRRFGSDVVLGRTGIVVSTFVRVHSSRLTAAPAVAVAPTGRQVAALQLRRPRSLRPQGVLNVAVTLLGAAQARAVAPIYHMPGSPDAFAMKDLVAMRPAPFLSEITEEGAAEERGLEYYARRQRPLVEHSGPLDPRGAAIEQSKLAMKLEKWRVDLSPDHGDHDGRGGGKSGRWLRRTSCFGRQESWER